MKTKLRISLCQMRISSRQVDENLVTAEGCISQASLQGGQLVLLPELWSTGFDLQYAHHLAQPIGSGTFQFMAEQARKHQIYLGGSLLELEHDQAYNTFALFNPNGELAAHYRKIHLFHLLDEHHWIAPGNMRVIVDLPIGKVGLAICYDLRFPELFRQYAIDGVHLFLLPSEWPQVRINHFRTLIRARAIENQVAMAAVNSSGLIQSQPAGGCSALVDAWGETIAEAGSGPQVITGEVDLQLTESIREDIHILNDRRPDLYY